MHIPTLHLQGNRLSAASRGPAAGAGRARARDRSAAGQEHPADRALGPDPDVVSLMQSQYAFLTRLTVFRSDDWLMGRMVDERA